MGGNEVEIRFCALKCKAKIESEKVLAYSSLAWERFITLDQENADGANNLLRMLM
jgi:hypothetical protein